MTASSPEITIEDAYQIQPRMLACRLEKGERVVGKRIGVTSKVVMHILNAHQPDFGWLTSGMAFVLKRTSRAPG